MKNCRFLIWNAKVNTLTNFITKRGYNVTPYSLALNDTAKYSHLVYAGLDSMLTKNSLNTSDITNVNTF